MALITLHKYLRSHTNPSQLQCDVIQALVKTSCPAPNKSVQTTSCILVCHIKKYAVVCFFVIQPLSDTYIQSNTTQQALVLKQQVYGCEQANTATTLHISLCLSLGKIFLLLFTTPVSNRGTATRGVCRTI